jgi:ACR3 family arsenite efflux pump ArsB
LQHVPKADTNNEIIIRLKGMNAMFWQFAYRRYQTRKPMPLTDFAAFVWFAFFALVYGSALSAGWLPTNIVEVVVGFLLIVVPLVVGILLRRIRIEAAKSPDALYRKWIEANR